MESKAKAGGAFREESALNMFRQLDLKGKAKDDTQLNSVHQNTISTIREYEVSGGNVRKFTSTNPPLVLEVFLLTIFQASGVDGRLVIWKA